MSPAVARMVWLHPQTPVSPYIRVGGGAGRGCRGPRLRHRITSALRPRPRSLASQALPSGREGRMQETGLSVFPRPSPHSPNIWSQTSALRLCRTAGASLAPICRRPRRPPHLCPALPGPPVGSHGPARAARAPICRAGALAGDAFEQCAPGTKPGYEPPPGPVLLSPKSLQEQLGPRCTPSSASVLNTAGLGQKVPALVVEGFVFLVVVLRWCRQLALPWISPAPYLQRLGISKYLLP